MTLNHAQRAITQAVTLRLGTHAAARLDFTAPNTSNRDREARNEPLRRSQAAAAQREPATGPTERQANWHDREEYILRAAGNASRSILNNHERAAYMRLVLLAIEIGKRRGLSPHTSELTFFAPADAVAADTTSHSRKTFYRWRRHWRALGLVDSRPHVTTAHGRNIRDGTLWTLRLRFEPGKRARVRHEALKHQGYRDLENDIRTGRTAFRQVHHHAMTQSGNPTEEWAAESLTLYWALPPADPSTPLPLIGSPAGRAASISDVLALRNAGKHDRGPLVDATAQAIARELADHTSLNYYRWLLWQLLRLLDTGTDLLDTIHQQILRARADHTERFARRAGALLQTRLRRAGTLELIRNAPRNRVGTAPAT